MHGSFHYLIASSQSSFVSFGALVHFRDEDAIVHQCIASAEYVEVQYIVAGGSGDGNRAYTGFGEASEIDQISPRSNVLERERETE